MGLYGPPRLIYQIWLIGQRRHEYLEYIFYIKETCTTCGAGPVGMGGGLAGESRESRQGGARLGVKTGGTMAVSDAKG
jgi:hypothetical protein